MGRTENRSSCGTASYGLGPGGLLFCGSKYRKRTLFLVGNVDGNDWHRIARKCACCLYQRGRCSVSGRQQTYPKFFAARHEQISQSPHRAQVRQLIYCRKRHHCPRACVLQWCLDRAPAVARLMLPRAPAPKSVSLWAPRTAFQTPLAAMLLQRASFPSRRRLRRSPRPPVGQAASRDKRRCKACRSLKHASLERCIWKDILLGSFVLSLPGVSRALRALWVAPLGDIGPSSTVVIEKSDKNHAERQQPH